MLAYNSIYYAISSLATKSFFNNKGKIYGSIFLYVIIISLFQQVFAATTVDYTRLWYCGVTEWITIASVPLSIAIQNDLNSHNIVYYYNRPKSYLLLKFIESFSVAIMRLIMLGIIAIIYIGFLTKHMLSFKQTIITFGFGLLSIVLVLLMQILIGLLAFWLREIKEIDYLDTTASFALGGLILPLDYYPPIWQKIAFFTPYPWILYYPASAMHGVKSQVFMGYLFWVVLFIVLIKFIYNYKIKSFLEDS